MIYLIYGDQEMLVNKMIDKVAKDNLQEVDDFNFVTLDASKVGVNEVDDEINTLPFGSENKVVAITNCYFLTSSNNECLYNAEHLLSCLDYQLDGLDLIVSVISNKLDEKRVVVKKLKSVGKVIEVNSLSKKELPKVVKQMFAQRKSEITDSALEELLSRLDNDMYQISNEVDKLTTYSNKIHLEDVKALTPKKMEDNVFDMIDAMFKKKANKAFSIYQDLRNLGNEAVGIVSIIASQVRFLYQVLVLYNKGYSDSNIANELSVHPFRVKMGLEKVRNYSVEELEEFLNRLSNLDIQIKTGDIDRFVGLELFILTIAN